ncbi:TRAP transporter substrate-binding protein [Hwanghaeella grinnelliae]|uniref:TRAP transporter substrate-binding protein n=1 Tax=Hwanghaeella grinnelliae TaxID=2500179 RepID=A0A3S2W5Q3_9PROT|nr:TRAP transporter substrate-binding protein [Hwanghaeella grinnelliae]RVU37827.1 TRAP transporter substrate-binding protein [Hwanghaeella grinnelliae]
MKLSNLVKTAAMAGIVGAVTLTTAADPVEAKTRWKMHAAYASTVAVIGQPSRRVAAAVDAMSDGDFAIKVEEPGALVGGFAYFDPVSQGAFQAAWGTSGANQGKNSAFSFLSSWPFGPAAPEFVAWFKYGGGLQLAEELYARDNIKFVLCGMIPPETSGWFREEITSLDQLKGLKMRFFGVGAKVMQRFGVSTQQLAAADIYPALERGTIDATEFSMPAIDITLGLNQIAKHNYYPGWHQQSTSNELLVNMDAWNDLTDAQRAMLNTSCDAQIAEMIAEGEAVQFQAMKDNVAAGVTLHRWPQEVLDQFKAAWEDVLAEELAANPDSKKIWESISTFRENFKIWKDMGYL